MVVGGGGEGRIVINAENSGKLHHCTHGTAQDQRSLSILTYWAQAGSSSPEGKEKKKELG